MANTYSQLYYHIVFAVKDRLSHIDPTKEDKLYKYIDNIAPNEDGHILAINGTDNHVHILVSILPKKSVSGFVQSIKVKSSLYLKNQLGNPFFEWQNGYAVFSYSKSLLPVVIKYIKKQKEHHKVEKFSDEMENMLKQAEIEYQKEYILKDV